MTSDRARARMTSDRATSDRARPRMTPDSARPRATEREPHLRHGPTRGARAVALAFAGICAVAAAGTLAQAGLNAGFGLWDGVRVALIFVTTAWLAWGAAQALVGLRPLGPAPDVGLEPGARPATVILLPICNEDPVPAAARVRAMRASAGEAGIRADVAILSDTSEPRALERERAAFGPLLRESEAGAADGGGDGARVFYRNRTDNHGRKAGNIEEFIRNSGGAYDYAVILDADSLMEGGTIRHLVARMEAEPRLGLLQTLPRIVGAASLFGRAMQFAAGFHSPVFARGLARLQGATGPFWGHNAIVRIRAFSQCCGLPELKGPPPFGGTILSHDYVEAALLARGGWLVEMDPRIEGSYEEGPENLLAFARRDRRWCQGNLQHLRLIPAPGLRRWSRFVFAQGVLSYLVSVFWGMFLLASVAAMVTAPSPDYFPEAYQLFPVFPDDRTHQIVMLAIGIGGLLLLPKLAIWAEAALTGRARAFGGGGRAAGSVLAETALTSLIAPVMLMYQTRAVFEVFSGRDGGWPSTQRGEGRLSLAEGWRAGRWVALWGLGTLAVTLWLAPGLTLWLLPVTLPAIAAPLLISLTSRPSGRGVFTVPEEWTPPPVVAAYRDHLARRPARKADHDRSRPVPRTA